MLAGNANPVGASRRPSESAVKLLAGIAVRVDDAQVIRLALDRNGRKDLLVPRSRLLGAHRLFSHPALNHVPSESPIATDSKTRNAAPPDQLVNRGD